MKQTMLTLKPPYLIFLGDADKDYAKTAFGLAQWAPEHCLGQLRFAGSEVDLGLPDLTVQQAADQGVRSVVLGVAPVGGALPETWLPTIVEAINAGLDIVSGLHSKLTADPMLRELASNAGTQLIDVRVPPKDIPVGTGEKRVGKRLLTVGTDCVSGKKYTALALTKAMTTRGVDCDFRATGQTGIMIAGRGIPIDAVVSDFVAGAAELLSPAAAPDHWDIIEGQGALYHPGYAGVSLGLLHGAQPDAIVLCHDAVRRHLKGFPAYPVGDIDSSLKANLTLGALTNPAIRCVGLSVNTSQLPPDTREEYLAALQQRTGLPCVDPLIDGVEAIVDRLLIMGSESI
jgi:uncharacterized NAD-dependent epimerase/dehydratase family protein